MKIASLVPYKIIPAVNGGEKGIFLFLKHLAKYAQITCFTVSENKGDIENIEFLPVLGSTTNKWRYITPWLYFTIKKLCKERGLKHIIIEHPYYAWLGYVLKKYAGLKLIVHSHNIEASRFKTMQKKWWKVLYRYEKFAHQIADFNFFITEEDRQYAIKDYQLDATKCAVVTYGIEVEAPPTPEEKLQCRKIVCKELSVPETTKLILFNGTLDYAPNRDGLDSILKQINPILENEFQQPYKIIICGLRLPQSYQNLQAFEKHNIIYKGFVEDIGLYFKAADLFINPITDGGGIKTKLVEALAANTAAISFKAGAYGIPASITGNCLAVVPDGDTNTFAAAIIQQLTIPKENIPDGFFEHFSWDTIAKKAVGVINTLH